MWPFSKRQPPTPKIEATPDLPVGFGDKCTWYALPTIDTSAVADAIKLNDAQPCGWSQGIHAAYDQSVFITPPVEGWTFVVGFSLAPSTDDISPILQSRLETLSQIFGTALCFSTHRVVEFHLWAKAVKGSLIRAYGYVGESGETFWDEGEMTPEEQQLGFAFFDPKSPEAEDDDYWERTDLSYPDEDSVMFIADAWSISPIQLEQYAGDLAPSLGLLGRKSKLLSF